MNITITINTDNEAFGDDQWSTSEEVKLILRRLATTVEMAEVVEDCRLLDSNGNTVGDMKVSE